MEELGRNLDPHIRLSLVKLGDHPKFTKIRFSELPASEVKLLEWLNLQGEHRRNKSSNSDRHRLGDADLLPTDPLHDRHPFRFHRAPLCSLPEHWSSFGGPRPSTTTATPKCASSWGMKPTRNKWMFFYWAAIITPFSKTLISSAPHLTVIVFHRRKCFFPAVQIYPA